MTSEYLCKISFGIGEYKIVDDLPSEIFMEIGLKNTTPPIVIDYHSTSKMGRGETDDHGSKHTGSLLGVCMWFEHCSRFIEKHLV